MREAENGRDAIENAQQLRPDLIVLDLSMPVMNGLDAARVLKRLMPAEEQPSWLGVSSVVSKSESVNTLVANVRACSLRRRHSGYVAGQKISSCEINFCDGRR